MRRVAKLIRASNHQCSFLPTVCMTMPGSGSLLRMSGSRVGYRTASPSDKFVDCGHYGKATGINRSQPPCLSLARKACSRSGHYSSIAFRPAAVILRRTASTGLAPAFMVSRSAVASPARMRPATMSLSNPWARTSSASVAPCGLLASSFSNSSVRRGCGLSRRFRTVVIRPVSNASYLPSITGVLLECLGMASRRGRQWRVPVRKMSSNGQRCASEGSARMEAGLSRTAAALADPFRASRFHSTWGSDGTDPKRRPSGYVWRRALLLIGRWRARARELLAQAETMLDAEARQMMRDTAAKYERLAQQVEQRTGTADA